jgi:hypothetical protein
MIKTIEEVFVKRDYKKARKIIDRYKQELQGEIVLKQKNCKHSNFYRREYDESCIKATCRICHYEWDVKNSNASTQGKFEMTDNDRENWRKYQENLNAIDAL